jgi:hypothetical protein
MYGDGMRGSVEIRMENIGNLWIRNVSSKIER